MRSLKANVLSCFVVIMLSTVFPLLVHAQGVQTFKPNVYVNNNCNGYIEYLPEGYSTSGQTYPLLLFFEGIAEYGSGSLADLQKLLNNGPPRYISQGSFPSSFTVNGQTHRFIIITPQWKPKPGWAEPTAEEVNSLIDFCVRTYRVNTNKIYITGISSGGGPVWEYASANATYANRIAAIVPFCGTSVPTYAKARTIAAANLPVWAFHNRYDAGVPADLTKGYVDTINMAPSPNPRAKATIYDQGGHVCWYWELAGTYKENNMNVYEWMLQFSNNAPPPSNQLPVANAGTDKYVNLPSNSTTLSGSGSDPDGSIVSYAWTKVSGPSCIISTPTSASTSITGLVSGKYTFSLKVTDNSGAFATDNIIVTVNPQVTSNQPPVANAGADKTTTLPIDNVALAGSSSSDPDGSIVSYAWTKVSGPVGGKISSPSDPITSITGLTQGTHIYSLKVTDNLGATATDNVTVIVNGAPNSNQPPTANAGTDKTITLPTSTVTLNGSASDPDGTIVSYAWTKVSGPAGGTITSPTAASTTITGLTQGSYAFRLTVKDNAGASASDDVVVTVNGSANQPPTANAGADKAITLPLNSVTLSGSGSDADGTISSYAWTKVSGPAGGTISSPSSSSTTIT
ncbi:MAG TPA: PKD domain-containing protein, partial [Chitinophagaceae bacterium]|nr:PKD domain-containing protein [Chitinophagaceae bacterium]